MTDAERIHALCATEETISRDDVRKWMASDDLETLAAVYQLTEVAFARIQPELDFAETTAHVRRYLLRCIDENPPADDYVHAGFEAAWQLAACLKLWCKLDGAAPVLRAASAELKALYRRADETAKNRILCGVLEHALEDPDLRPHFGDWQRARDLREAHKLATEWGVAHERE